MRKLNRREVTLLGLLGAVGLAMFLNAGGGNLLGTRGPAGPELPPIEGDPPIVERALLTRPPASFDVNGRDLFKYYTPPPPPPPKREIKPYVAPPLPPPPPPPGPPKPVVPAEPQPPSPSFKYIGFLGTKENPIGVFLEGEEMMQAQIGDVVRQEFELVEFRYGTAVFGFTDQRFAGKTTELKLEGATGGAGAAGRSSSGRTARR